MIYCSHRAEQIDGYDAVIYTVAIGENNPEYQAAMQANLPVISRADYLGYLMVRYQTRIGIAGMHGKSTCTAMCAHIFLQAADPTVLCGAELPTLCGSTCHIGRDRSHFIFEACEYMDSFLDFYPTLAVILNVDLDHVDYFKSIEQVRESYLRYARQTGEGGTVLYNADSPDAVLAMMPHTGKKITFGFSEDADYRAQNFESKLGKTRFDIVFEGETLCSIEIPVPGLHNAYNALAAAVSALLCGIAPQVIADALQSFCGAGRRMQRKGSINGADVYDDYGHHPKEIKATLAAARSMGYKRVLCAFQPHTYSRTAGLWQDFVKSFDDADGVFLVDIYAAREQNTYGVSSDLLAGEIGEKAVYCHSFSTLADALAKQAQAGDLIIVMGAGDIFKIFELLPFDKE